MTKKINSAVQAQGIIESLSGGFKFPDGTTQTSQAPPYTLYTAKGQILVGKATSSADVLPASTDGYVLTLDSAQTLGLKWSPAAGGATGEVNATGRIYAFNNFR